MLIARLRSSSLLRTSSDRLPSNRLSGGSSHVPRSPTRVLQRFVGHVAVSSQPAQWGRGVDWNDPAIQKRSLGSDYEIYTQRPYKHGSLGSCWTTEQIAIVRKIEAEEGFAVLPNPTNSHVYPKHVTDDQALLATNIVHSFENQHAETFVQKKKKGGEPDLHQELLVRVKPEAFPPTPITSPTLPRNMSKKKYRTYPCIARHPGNGVEGVTARVRRGYLADGTRIILKDSDAPCHDPDLPHPLERDYFECNTFRETRFYEQKLMPLRLASIAKYYGCFERLSKARVITILLEDKGQPVQSLDDLPLEERYRIYETLVYLHQRDIVHGKVVLNHIVIDPQSQRASLVGFGMWRPHRSKSCEGEDICCELKEVRRELGIEEYRTDGKLHRLSSW